MKALVTSAWILFCAVPASAQMIVGAFDNDGQKVSLLADGRWGIVEKSEVKCGEFPQHNACFDYALAMSEEPELSPIEVDLKGASFVDAGVFAGRTWGPSHSETLEIAKGFVGQLASSFDVSPDRVKVISTEQGQFREHNYLRFEILTELNNGPLWSTITRVKDGSQTADVGTHVFGAFWATSPQMLEVRKDYHARLLQNLPLDWVNN